MSTSSGPRSIESQMMESRPRMALFTKSTPLYVPQGSRLRFVLGTISSAGTTRTYGNCGMGSRHKHISAFQSPTIQTSSVRSRSGVGSGMSANIFCSEPGTKLSDCERFPDPMHRVQVRLPSLPLTFTNTVDQ